MEKRLPNGWIDRKSRLLQLWFTMHLCGFCHSDGTTLKQLNSLQIYAVSITTVRSRLADQYCLTDSLSLAIQAFANRSDEKTLWLPIMQEIFSQLFSENCCVMTAARTSRLLTHFIDMSEASFPGANWIRSSCARNARVESTTMHLN